MTVDAHFFWGLKMPEAEWDHEKDDFKFPGNLRNRWDFEAWRGKNGGILPGVELVALGDSEEPELYITLRSKHFSACWEITRTLKPSDSLITMEELQQFRAAADFFNLDMEKAQWYLGAYGDSC